jgi:hypothetical protein
MGILLACTGGCSSIGPPGLKFTGLVDGYTAQGGLDSVIAWWTDVVSPLFSKVFDNIYVWPCLSLHTCPRILFKEV